jgi:hypothetical protein
MASESTPSQPSPAPPSSPSGGDRSKLVEAYQTLVRSERDRMAHEGEPGPPSGAGGRSLFLFATAVVLGLILVIQPSWLFTGARPPDPPQVAEASLRLEMFRAVELINDYKHQHRTLPATLAEAGVDSLGLHFTPDGEQFTLAGVNGRVRLSYSSSQDPREFLGDSYDVIRHRGKP